MSNISYHAKSLEDIAKMFDDMANNYKHFTNKITKIQAARSEGMSYAFSEAARILRQTKLEDRSELEKQTMIGDKFIGTD